MKKMLILLMAIFFFLSIGCATAPQKSPEVTFKAVIPFEKLNETAQKEAARLGYGPGDTVKIDTDKRGNAKIVPK